MGDRLKDRSRAGRTTIEPPRWSHCVMALAGFVLLIGPTLGVLWPR